MSVVLTVLFFALKVVAVLLGGRSKWQWSSLALSLASFCLAYFKEADSVALQRIWAATEKHWK
jgi:hypothetical protein